MVLVKPLTKVYTLDEYLDKEAKSDVKHEFYNGIIVEMPGGTFNHNKISTNILVELQIALKRKKEKYYVLNSDMKIHIASVNRVVYPDAVVICKAPSFYKERKDIINNPYVVVEVLSEGTKDYDRGTKLHRYQTLSSLQECLILEQDMPSAMIYTRKKDNLWEITEVKGLDKSITLKSLENTKIKLADIYDMINFEE